MLVKFICELQMAYLSTGSGAFFGAGAGANMLAQLFLTPSGMMLEVVLAAAAEDAAPAAVEPQLSSPEVFGASQDDASAVAAVSHALDSVVGTEVSVFSLLREPLVWATDAPRPRPPLPRSVPRPRPLPPSAPALPPRTTLPWFDVSPSVVADASLTFDLDLSFLAFETSPH